jgi:hypothetical protein
VVPVTFEHPWLRHSSHPEPLFGHHNRCENRGGPDTGRPLLHRPLPPPPPKAEESSCFFVCLFGGQYLYTQPPLCLLSAEFRTTHAICFARSCVALSHHALLRPAIIRRQCVISSCKPVQKTFMHQTSENIHIQECLIYTKPKSFL